MSAPSPEDELDVIVSAVDEDATRRVGAVALAKIVSDRDRYAETLRFVRQSVHQAHHEGTVEACPKNTCDAVALALGERVQRS